jgi:hypothetical protein
MVQKRSKEATRIRRMKCRVREQSAVAEKVASAIDELLDAESVIEQFENLEVLLACMEYVGRKSRWPTTEEIAAMCGLDLTQVLALEKRLRGTYEFALRAGLIEDFS